MSKQAPADNRHAAIIGDDGRVQAQFSGIGAEQDAKSTLRQCHMMKHMHGATVVTGAKAREAMEKRRL